MKIAYLYNRPVSEGVAMGADKTFADYKGTSRRELIDLLDSGGLRDGDTLLMRAIGDLGKGQESARMQRRVADIGATLEVVPSNDAPRVQGRPPRLSPTDDQKQHLCALWYSPAPVDHVLGRAGGIMGAKVTRNQMNRWCGARGGTSKKEQSS